MSKVRLNQSAFKRLGVDLQKKFAQRVLVIARKSMGKSVSSPGMPPGVNTGNLKSGLYFKISGTRIDFMSRNRARHAVWLEKGTGLYGKFHRRIYPKTATVLSWIGRDGKRVFAASTEGIKKRPFIAPAIRKTFREMAKKK